MLGRTAARSAPPGPKRHPPGHNIHPRSANRASQRYINGAELGLFPDASKQRKPASQQPKAV